MQPCATNHSSLRDRPAEGPISFRRKGIAKIGVTCGEVTRHEPSHFGAASQEAGLPGCQVILLGRVRRVRLEEGALDEQHIRA